MNKLERRQLYLLINRDCNLNCNFCIRGGSTKDSRIDITRLETIFQRDDFSLYTLFLTGGEPSLNKDLSSIIELSYPYFRRICVNTNGIKSDWIDILSISDIHVQISLDGTRSMHNSFRGGGEDLYSKILSTIDKLNQKGEK